MDNWAIVDIAAECFVCVFFFFSGKIFGPGVGVSWGGNKGDGQTKIQQKNGNVQYTQAHSAKGTERESHLLAARLCVVLFIPFDTLLLSLSAITYRSRVGVSFWVFVL